MLFAWYIILGMALSPIFMTFKLGMDIRNSKPMLPITIVYLVITLIWPLIIFYELWRKSN